MSSEPSITIEKPEEMKQIKPEEARQLSAADPNAKACNCKKS
jgi:hypothetical protein